MFRLGLFLTLAVAAVLPAQEILTNKSVIEMVGAGIPEEIIITKIRNSKTSFDLSTAELAKLTQAKVPTAVIKVMIEPKPNDPGTVAGASGNASTNPHDPDAPHDAGIYMYVERNGAKQMTILEPTVYTQGKTAGLWKSALTYGIAKGKFKAVVRGSRANLRTTDPQPVFYFYFEEKAAGLSHAGFATTSPNEFTLLKFEVKSDSRETVVMSYNAFGASTGTDEKATVQFKHEKLRPGVYKVTPIGKMAAGEYCFLASGGMAGAGGASRLFDFSIIAAE